MVRARAAIGFGLLLALAATLAPLPTPGDAPGASLTVRLPALVQMLVLGLAALCALLLLFLQHPRRRAEDELVVARARRPSAWTALLSLLPFVALLGAAWYYVATRGPGDEADPIVRAISAITHLMDLLALARKPPTSLPFVDLTVAALLLAGALALFGLLLLVTFAERLDRWWTGREADPVATAPTPPAMLPDPGAEPDARAAVILAWAGFERALAEARAPRALWQTPAETTRAALAQLPLPRAAAQRLTLLFELARFSNRPLDAQARAAACASLEEITAALASSRAGQEDAGRAG